MRKFLRQYLAAAPIALGLGLACSAAVMAKPTGHLDWANAYTIAGWSWDADSPDQTMEITIDITAEGADKPAATFTVAADIYRGDLISGDNDGNHGFFCPVEWDQLSGDSFTVTAYAGSGDSKIPLSGTITYDAGAKGTVLAVTAEENGEGDADDTSYGPLGEGGGSGSGPLSTGGSASESDEKTDTVKAAEAEPKKADSPVSETASSTEWKKGPSLGIFTITGYCSCSICSGGWGLTYSGTVPQANHTISADLDVFPIGTKLMIDGIVYTVEDKGSNVNGGHIDIYFATHEEAVGYGTQTAEVFAVTAG